MGIYDRDYLRDEQKPRPQPKAPPWTIVKWLLVLNIGIFVLGNFLPALMGNPKGPSLNEWGAYSYASAVRGWQIWRFFTYQFLHAGFMHVVTNMMGLYFFGPLVERYWGRRRFLVFYLLCGASGALVMSILSFIPGLLEAGPEAILIGASGSIFGILICTAVVHPNLEIQLLFPPITLKMKTFALGLIAISVVIILASWKNAGGEAAHLGGALLGFLFMRNPQWLDWVEQSAGARPKFKTYAGRKSEVLYDAPSESPKDWPVSVNRADVDRVLDKISSHGIHSLNDEERRILERAREDLK